MKTKVLVSNRSEIACRVFQSCRELGLTSVAIVAPGDEEARHLTYADEVWSVPSYLDIPSIVEVAQKSGASLIHPGYGFLSERPAFARALEQVGLIFVGPRAETMDLMGGKISAKLTAAQASVPTLPWARVESTESIVEAAKKVGFPLLLKASAGGGGKGMRRVDRLQDVQSAAESASAEAIAAFGDGTLFIERLIERPRHIEVQVFGDGLGGGIHLYERDCSLQRRHQKIWEEAQAPVLSEKARQGLFEAALRLVQKTKYRSAGTLEFLVDEHDQFYFLEMNTRLQVEHPVTESVTGVDLVTAQLLQALHPKTPYFKSSPSTRGHSIEVRLYAEDPIQGFIPTPGRVEKLKWPTGIGIRVESGIEEGQSVGTQFDSMLGKLIVFAEDRAQALKRLQFALEETVILGLGTNQNYLWQLTQNPLVRDGNYHTHFLAEQDFHQTAYPSSSDLALWWDLKALGLTRLSAVSGVDPQGSSQKPPSPWIAASHQEFIL